MNFMEALKKLREGGKVKLQVGVDGYCSGPIFLSSSGMQTHMVDRNGLKFYPTILQMECNLWEIVEEPKKSLSDELIGTNYYYEGGVKEHLNEFIKWYCNEPIENVGNKDFRKKAREIFGQRLIQ